jgi:flagellar basal-body rod modification protein FlgD
MIDSITQSAQVAGASSGVTANSSNGLDKDAFMKLLVAQLRYQDPMNPADGQEYLAQAAQFAQVERLEEMAKLQSEALAYQQILLSSSLVGRQVKAVDGDDTVEGVVSAVKFDTGRPVLIVGDKQVPVGAVDEIATA